MQEFDITMMPSTSQLREACGFYSKATVCEAGIKFGGAIYANDFTRRQRAGPVAERLVAPGKSVEIKIDPFDLGSILVVAKGELISVLCRG